jgi:serine/threonine-protein kinase
MSEENTQVWQKAINIYADISELSVKKAMSHVNNLTDLDKSIKQLVITLISSGNQASVYIQENLTPNFNDYSFDILNYQVGSLLGEYKLIKKLGQGGMSQVYKAKRLNDEPQKQVAIKIFSPKNFTPQMLEHFINEQNILARFNHPNIVDMLHGGKTKDNITYLVMELIENALPINQYCKQNNSTNKEKISYIYQCANALSYSHANLIIHRDLKPDNILIDHNKTLKIVDFGIAKLINNDLNNDNTTIMALTPSYAAPEQINSEHISIKTDVFSLAVVALELLANHRVLPKNRLLKSCAQDEQTIDQCIKSLNVDKDIKNVLRKALQINPSQRYASMQSFADDLQNYLQHKPVTAASQSFYYRIKKFAQRDTALFVSISAFIVLLLVGFAVTLWQYNKITLESSKAQHVKQFMLDSFNVTNPNISQGNALTANEILKVAANKLDENLKLDKDIKFELYQSLAIAYKQLGLPNEAITLFKKSLLINGNDSKSIAYLAASYLQAEEQHALDKLLSDTDETKFDSVIDQANFSLVRAENLSINGHGKQAITLITKIQNLEEIKNSAQEQIKIQLGLSNIYYELSNYAKTIKVLKSILSKTQLLQTHTLILKARLDLGRTYNTMGEHQLALDQFNQIERLYKKILGDKHPDLGTLYYRMASSYKATGQIQKAREYAQLSYKTNVNIFGSKGSQVASSLNMLAVLAQNDGQLDKAIDLTEKGIEILNSSYDSDLPQLLELKTNYAHLLGLKKQHKKAFEILSQVYTTQKEKIGPYNFSTLNTESSLVSALISLKKIAQAKELILAHIKRVESHVNSKNILTLNAYTLLARVYAHTKEKQKRLDTFLTIEKKKMVDESSPYYVMILFNIAQAYNQVKNTEMADQYFQKAFQYNARIYPDTHISTLQMKIQHAKYLYGHQKYAAVEKTINAVKQVIKQQNYNNSQLNSWIKKLDQKLNNLYP